MILGIGSDLIDVRRIERTMTRHGERFLARIFTATERATALDSRAGVLARSLLVAEPCRLPRALRSPTPHDLA